MEVTKPELTDLYKNMDSESLQNLYLNGELTDIAISVIEKELSDRNIPFKENKIKDQENKKEEKNKTIPENIIKRIKSSVTALYVISILQIITSVIYEYNLGILYGLVLLALTYSIRIFKSSNAAIAVTILGVIALITNITIPIMAGITSGNIILSLVVIMLGIKLSKNCNAWVKYQIAHNKSFKPTPKSGGSFP